MKYGVFCNLEGLGCSPHRASWHKGAKGGNTRVRDGFNVGRLSSFIIRKQPVPKDKLVGQIILRDSERVQYVCPLALVVKAVVRRTIPSSGVNVTRSTCLSDKDSPVDFESAKVLRRFYT